MNIKQPNNWKWRRLTLQVRNGEKKNWIIKKTVNGSTCMMPCLVLPRFALSDCWMGWLMRWLSVYCVLFCRLIWFVCLLFRPNCLANCTLHVVMIRFLSLLALNCIWCAIFVAIQASVCLSDVWGNADDSAGAIVIVDDSTTYNFWWDWCWRWYCCAW